MKRTQQEWVVKMLLENGKISRNEALRNYVSRLGAIICDLRKAGWEISAKNERTHGGYGRGLDYVYKLVKKP